MRRVLEWQERAVDDSESAFGFETKGGGSWPVWDRYLTLDGKRLYHIGNICGTCQFLFECVGGVTRRRSLNVTAQDLVQAMTTGLTSLSPSFLDPISHIIPRGDYVAALFQTLPTHVAPRSDRDYFAHEQVDVWGLDEWNLPHHPKINYYRGFDQTLSGKAQLYEFIVPMFPDRWLDEKRIDEFRSALQGGASPTALAVSVLDIKQQWNSDIAHWCLTHYLVDGHHKMMAASMEGKPLTILSFIATKEGISSREDINHLVQTLSDTK